MGKAGATANARCLIWLRP